MGSQTRRHEGGARGPSLEVPPVASPAGPRPTKGEGRRRPDRRRSSLGEVFTLGYQGRSLEDVLDILRLHRIDQVLDVRQYASSRRAGFSAHDLNATLAGIGIAYVHLPDLGCRGEARHALWRGGARAPFLEEYRRDLEGRSDSVAALFERVRGARSLLLCLERDPTRCHRAVLAEKLGDAGFVVVDLGS